MPFLKVVFFRNCQHVVVEVWSCNSAWTMDSQQYVLKSCTIAKRVYYPGTRTLFFCTAGLVPETFSFIVTCFLNFVQPLKENLLMAQFASNPFQVVYLFSNKKITIYPKKKKRESKKIHQNGNQRNRIFLILHCMIKILYTWAGDVKFMSLHLCQ